MKQKKVLSEWEKKDKNYLDKKKRRNLGSWPISSPQPSVRRRRRESPPRGGAAAAVAGPGHRRRDAGAGPEGGGDCHFGHGKKRSRGREGGIPIPRRRKGSSFWLGLSCTEEVEMEVVLQRRRRRRRRGRDHDDDIYGCRGGSIHRIARCEWEVGSLCFTLSSPLFSSPLIYTSTPLSLSLSTLLSGEERSDQRFI